MERDTNTNYNERINKVGWIFEFSPELSYSYKTKEIFDHLIRIQFPIRPITNSELDHKVLQLQLWKHREIITSAKGRADASLNKTRQLLIHAITDSLHES